MVSTRLKNISQIGSSSQVGVKIKNIRNHHLYCFWKSHRIPPEECPERQKHRATLTLFLNHSHGIAIQQHLIICAWYVWDLCVMTYAKYKSCRCPIHHPKVSYTLGSTCSLYQNECILYSCKAGLWQPPINMHQWPLNRSYSLSNVYDFMVMHGNTRFLANPQ